MSRRYYLRHQVRKFIQVGRQSGWDVAITRAMASIQAQWKQYRESRQRTPGCTYPEWILQHESQDSPPSDLHLDHAHRFSLLLPVHELECEWLSETVGSLLEQQYPKWELILALASSYADQAAACLRQILEDEPRIRLKVIDPWQSASAALNIGIDLSAGDYILALSQGDLLASNALQEFALLLEKQPDVDIIYSDEDQRLDHGSTRVAPWFKPTSFSPALLLSVNYLANAVIRKELVTSLGGYDEQMELAHVWDLSFRCVERTQRIAHIAKVLTHVRQTDQASGNNAMTASATWDAEKHSVLAHLSRKDPQKRSYDVSRAESGALHVALPVSGRRVSIIIPTKDRLALISACIGSILERTSYPDFEILIIDTGSKEPSVLDYYHRLEGDQRIRMVKYSGQFNYSAANNLGAQHASGDYYVFLNNDTRITQAGWLDELVGWAEQPGVGVVGVKLVRPNGTIQHAGMVLGLAGHSSHVFDGSREPVDGPFGRPDWYRNYLAVTGACMLVPRTVFEQLGGFDAGYQIGYSDVEFCLRAIGAGYQVVYTPFAELVHDEGGTRGLALPPSDVLRAWLHFQPVLHTGDPYYNPNLSQLSRRPVPACKGEESRMAHVERILRRYGLVSPSVEKNVRFDRYSDTGWPILLLSDLADQQAQDSTRLLLVSHDFSLSGAPTILFKLALYLHQRGYRVTALSPTDGPLRQRYLETGIDARVEPLILEDARVAVETILAHSLLLANTILSWRAVHAAKALGKPSVWWIHEAEAGRDQARFDEHIASAFLAAWKIVFPTGYTAAMYAPFDHVDNYVTVPIGVRIADSAETYRQTPEKQEGLFKLVSVGSIEPRKGQDILLAALAKLPAEIRPHITCTFIGRVLDPSYLEKLTRMVQTRRLHGVSIVGEVSSREVQSHLQACDVFVLPSRSEALPGALLEAMAHGKAVIAANVGGVPEVVTGDNGLSFPAGDVQALADQIASLFGDRVALDRLGEKARQTIQERFTFDAFAERMQTLVEEGLLLTSND